MALVEQVAGAALETTYDGIPTDEIHQTKRLLLDTLSCAFGGLGSTTAAALRRAAPVLGNAPEATAIGGGGPQSALNALLINGALVRYLDMNDVQQSLAAPGPRHGHNSEFFPLVLALAERQRLSGRDVITASWLGYELSTRFTESVLGDSLESRGWNLDLRAAFVGPILAGRLLGLSPGQIESAVGTALSRGLLLEVIDSSQEVNSMAKNLRVPLGIYHGLVATYLAEAGLTGPARALEGRDGFIETVLGGDFDIAHLLDPSPRSAVNRAVMKRFAACFATHGHLSATLDLVAEHDLSPQDVTAVDIVTTPRGAGHTGDPGRRHPSNKETADHSSYYVTAAIVAFRELGPHQYDDALYNDSELHRLAEGVSIAADPEYASMYPAARVTMTLADGTRLERFVQRPPGHPDNPLTDSDIEAKLRSLAAGYVNDETLAEIIDATWRLEEFDDIRRYMRLFATASRPNGQPMVGG
jgi:2-methylcitrate dehydratase